MTLQKGNLNKSRRRCYGERKLCELSDRGKLRAEAVPCFETMHAAFLSRTHTVVIHYRDVLVRPKDALHPMPDVCKGRMVDDDLSRIEEYSNGSHREET